MSTRNRWLDWTPAPTLAPTKPTEPAQNFLENVRDEPKKPQKPGSLGFRGAPPANFQNFLADSHPQAPPGESDTSGGRTSGEVSPVADQPDAPEPTAVPGESVPSVHGVDNATETEGEFTLKGQAVELWRDGRRFFLVADEEDAQEAMRRFGAHRGEVWASGELELVASIPDQAIRDEVESLKRQLDDCLAPDAAGQGVPWAEYQAKRLNELFRAQGLLGEPAKVTSKSIKHGERKGK